MSHKYSVIKLLTILFAVLYMPGCGTISNNGKQTVFIQTIAENKVVDSKCSLKNSLNTWYVDSSNDIILDKSAGDLVVECQSKDRKYFGKEIVSSKTNSSMWASIMTFGVAAAVDATSSAGFDYPNNIMIIMKKLRRSQDD